MTTIAPIRVLAASRNRVLVARGRELIASDIQLSSMQSVASLPKGMMGRVAPYSRSLRRLLRYDPTSAVFISDDQALINLRDGIWLLDFETGRLSLDFQIPDGRRALQMSLVRGVTGIADGVYFGDYFINPDKLQARVWFRSDEGTGMWSEIHSFSKGEVNHVHGVVGDGHRGGLWVLTGDFGDAASIHFIDGRTGEMHKMFGGEQAHRATWMDVRRESLYYATDSQLESNYLMKISFPSGSPPTLSPVEELPGSSIYGVRSSDGMYFSTAVEGGAQRARTLAGVLSTRPGPGILDDRAYCFRLDNAGKLSPLLWAKKDSLPFGLFQIGTFLMTARPGGGAYANGQAVMGLDGRCVVLQPDRSHGS